jgi:hypothetical protein
LPAGVYLKSRLRPVLFPFGHEVDEEIFFAIRLTAESKKSILLLHRYAFRLDPGRHTKRAVCREGYWHFDTRVATSSSESTKYLKDLILSLEVLACDLETIRSYPERVLTRIVAWEERLETAQLATR